MPRYLKLHRSYNDDAIILQLYIVKNDEFKEKEIIAF